MSHQPRPSQLTLPSPAAYLIKYQDYTLKNAFCYLKSLRACARPNIGFFEQLMQFEKVFRGSNSTHMTDVKRPPDDQRSARSRPPKPGAPPPPPPPPIRVPDFYKVAFPDLYKAEVKKQIASTRSQKSKCDLQESNKNYINRQRGYDDMMEDMEVIQDEDSELDNAPSGESQASKKKKKKDKDKAKDKGKDDKNKKK